MVQYFQTAIFQFWYAPVPNPGFCPVPCACFKHQSGFRQAVTRTFKNQFRGSKYFDIGRLWNNGVSRIYAKPLYQSQPCMEYHRANKFPKREYQWNIYWHRTPLLILRRRSTGNDSAGNNGYSAENYCGIPFCSFAKKHETAIKTWKCLPKFNFLFTAC